MNWTLTMVILYIQEHRACILYEREKRGGRISGDIRLLEEVKGQYNRPALRYVFCFVNVLTFYFIDFLCAVCT
jgi:hypothetical protein